MEISFTSVFVMQQNYHLTFEQLQDAEGEVLGEVLTEAVMQGLRQVVVNEAIEIADYNLLIAVNSNSFRELWHQSRKNISLAEWLEYGRIIWRKN